MNDKETFKRDERPNGSPSLGERFDEITAKKLGRFSEATSRRGFLAFMGKASMGALGFSLLAEALPSDRRSPALADHTCSDPRYCGLYGRNCKCCNGGNPMNYCPYGTFVGTWWAACCKHVNQPHYDWTFYWDCCGGSVNCTGCLRCSNGPPQPVWGCGSSPYRCTAVVQEHGNYC